MDGFRSGVFESALPYLEFLIERQEEMLLASSYELAFQLDIEFHRIFYNLTDKEFVIAHTGEKDIHYLRARLLALQLEKPIAMPSQHRAMVKAIREHDEKALEKAFFEHLGNVNLVYKQNHPAAVPYVH